MALNTYEEKEKEEEKHVEYIQEKERGRCDKTDAREEAEKGRRCAIPRTNQT